jgi:predicted protein tyrosine phosphatase
MYESVVFHARYQIKKMDPDANAIIISLTQPGDPVSFATGWRDVLPLEFDDICEEVFGLPEGAIPAEQEYYTHEFGAPTYRMAFYRPPAAIHAKAIRSFLARHEGGDMVRVIVHCDQGKSRSAAVAQFVSEQYGVPILNADLIKQGRVSMSDTSWANPRLLRLLRQASLEN